MQEKITHKKYLQEKYRKRVNMSDKASKTKKASKFKGFNNILAVRLRQLMYGSGTTQQELAEKTGCSRQAIAQYMDGSNAPNIDKLILIAEFFNVSIDYLVGKDKEQTEEEFVQSIVNYTGLDEKSVEVLHNLKCESTNEIEETVKKISAVFSGRRSQDTKTDLSFINTFINSQFNAVFNHPNSYLYEYCRNLKKCIEIYNQVIDFEIQDDFDTDFLFQKFNKFDDDMNEIKKKIRVEKYLITDDFNDTLDYFVNDMLFEIRDKEKAAREKLNSMYLFIIEKDGENNGNNP